jgi:hypothetical protein
MAHIRIESPGIAAKVSPIWSVITNACLHGIRFGFLDDQPTPISVHDVSSPCKAAGGLVVQVAELVMQPIAVA